MGLKTLLDEDQFGELDESTRGLYAQGDDGKYVLDVEGIDDHPTVQSLKSGHQRSKKERDEAKKRAKELEGRLGPLVDVEDLDFTSLDEDGVSALSKYLKGEMELVEPGSSDKNKGIDPEKIKQAARKPLENELKTTTEERDQLRSQLQQVVVNNALTEAVSEIKVHGPFVSAVKAMFKDKIKVETDDDGNIVALVEGEYGEQPVSKYMKEWAQTDEGKAFIEADRNGGGGARGGSGSGKVKNPWSPDNWNMGEQGRIIREDPERAKRMAEEYGKRVG